MRIAASMYRLLFAVSALTACGGSRTSEPTTPPPPPPPPAPVIVAVQVAPATVALGGAVLRTARAEDADGKSISGASFTWASDNPAIAMVSPSGQVTGVSAGEATIRASAGGKTGSATMTVSDLRWGILPPQNASSCGLTDSAELYCWGAVGGGIGGPTADSNHESCVKRAIVWCFSTPRRMSTIQQFTSLAVGPSHVCGLTPSGEAWCWGGNDRGQLGSPSSETCAFPGLIGPPPPCSRTPIAVSGGLRFVSLVAHAHSCGLTAGGEAWCWGDNRQGKLGAAGFAGAFSQVPLRAGGTLLFSSVTVGDNHSCGIALDGVTYCWGDTPGLGSNRPAGRQATPVDGGFAFTSISTGLGHSCGVTPSGAAYCWGAGGEGQLGNAGSTDATSPVLVLGGHTFRSVSAGVFYTCGLDTSGKAWCWGLNYYGSLGIGGPAPIVCGDGTCASTPMPVYRGLTFASLNAGYWVTCGLTVDRRAYCWGRNAFGGVGNGLVDGEHQFAPVGVAGVP